MGRFGWKADVPSLIAQTTGAFVHDMGIHLRLEPDHPHHRGAGRTQRIAHGGLPEVDDQKVERIVGYLERIAVPQIRDVEQAEVRRAIGISPASAAMAVTFQSFEPESIRLPSCPNSEFSPIPICCSTTWGPRLADGFASHTANGQEWRTPPLWGLGLISVVNGHTRLLHDGRAHSIEEAIVWHGGEGRAVSRCFYGPRRK